PGELATDLAPTAANALDLHLIVARGLVAHPRDHRRTGTLFDRNVLCACDGAAADRCRVGGDESGKRTREVIPARREAQERVHLVLEFQRVRSMTSLAARDIGLALLGIRLGRALRVERSPRGLDVLSRRPQALRE